MKGQTLVWAHNIHATPIQSSMISALQQRYPDLSTYSVMQLGFKGTLAANTPDHSRWLKETETFKEENNTLNYALYSAGYPDVSSISLLNRIALNDIFRKCSTYVMRGERLPHTFLGIAWMGFFLFRKKNQQHQ
ncbi:TraB/GumN family protein [Vibrio navarrensis]|uniref:hypothetical protein n=1 Tax=Vibrio navarrensis TaxID=29495 RepID=UPI001D050090|nr:hypothetical protein [Vibrio navarrensis]